MFSKMTFSKASRGMELCQHLRPIPKKAMDWMLRKSAKHIFIADKEGNGYCERCGKNIILPKTKHLSKCKCPQCNAELEVIHEWRRKYTENLAFYVMPKVLNPKAFVLRYVYIERIGKKITEAQEVAREVVDFESNKWWQIEKNYRGEWIYNHTYWFAEKAMYQFRKRCCYYADAYTPGFNKEVNKLEALKHLNVVELIPPTRYVSTALGAIIDNNSLLEQLQKTGMEELAEAYVRESWITDGLIDNTKTNLYGKLKLDRNRVALLKTRQSIEVLKWLQVMENATEEDFINAEKYEFCAADIKFVKKYKLKYRKTISYVDKLVTPTNNFMSALRDYSDYVETLDSLGYPLDESYLFPKDFRKEDERVQKEERERRERRYKMSKLDLIKEEAERDMTIRKISQALAKSPELKTWMQGSQGLKVVVPESVGELVDAGIHLHNCLQNYGQRIADKQCLIFFIRRIEQSDKDYIAMEYANGEIQQIRYDHNIAVEDEKILSFANALAERLNKMDFINELRRAA